MYLNWINALGTLLQCFFFSFVLSACDSTTTSTALKISGFIPHLKGEKNQALSHVQIYICVNDSVACLLY